MILELCDKVGACSQLGLFTLHHFRLGIMTAAVPDVLQQDLIDIKTLLLALNHLLQVRHPLSLAIY